MTQNNDKYVVYTELLNNNGKVERWYYGTYNHSRANEVAEQLGQEYGCWHCVCAFNDAEKLGIKNMTGFLWG